MKISQKNGAAAFVVAILLSEALLSCDAAESDSGQVRAAINANLCLARWEVDNPKAWDLAVNHDARLRNSTDWNDRSIADRFVLVSKLVRMELPDAKCYDKLPEVPKPPATESTSKSVVFSPAGCEFSVQFKTKPKIETYTVPVQDHTCVSNIAWTLSEDKTSAIKADCTVCPKDVRSSAPSEIEVISTLKEHALQSGVENAVFSFKTDGTGSIGIYRGVLKSAGNTFISAWYFGRHSGLSLVGSAPFASFSELHFDEFMKSTKRR